MVIRRCPSWYDQQRLTISILLVGFRASPWQLRQVWRFCTGVQPAVILSESEYSFFLPVPPSYPSPPPALLVPLSFPSVCIYPLISCFCFHFSSFLDSTYLYFMCLASPFCVVRGASSLTCLYPYTRNIENRITQFLSKGFLSIPQQGEESLERRGIARLCSPEYSMFSAYPNLPDVLAAEH